MARKNKGLLLVIVMLMVAALSGCVYEPLETDLNTKNIYPIATNTYDIGSVALQYDGGYFREIYLNGVLLVPGVVVELDPVFTGSDAFGITALDIAGWNNHPPLTTGTHGVAGTIVGTSDAQSLTNKNLTMNNATPIYWKNTLGALVEVIELWADDNIHIFDGVSGDIFLWQGSGTNQRLFLWSTGSTAISTTKDSPAIDLVANYWNAGNANWESKIIHNMVTAGATPKSRLEFDINGDDILRLENDNGVVKTYSDGTLDMTNNNIVDAKKLNLTDPTELTIAAGAITVTQGYHTVDTQGDASSDDLDTINGGTIGDELILAGANDARSVQLTRNGNIRFEPEHMTESFGFVSPAGSSGTYYTGGFYAAPAAKVTLTQASTTVSYGTAQSPTGVHYFLVAGGAGTTDVGTVSIVVSGSSITDAGVLTAGDTETLVPNITTMALNSYYETTKRWVGAVTYTITPAGGATTYSATFNYGKAVYDSFNGRKMNLHNAEFVGRAGANDTGFDIQVLYHKQTGWTYSAAAFVPGTTPLCSLVTDYGVNNDLVSGEHFSYNRDLNQAIDGTNREGFLIRIVTTANKAVDFMNSTIYAECISNDQHLNTTGQSIKLIYNGTNWMQN